MIKKNEVLRQRIWTSLLPFLLLACGGESQAGESAPQATPIEVVLTQVRVGEVDRRVDVVGTLFGEEEAALSSKVSGRVAKILHDVGDRVSPGAPLAELDKTDYLLLKQQKETALLEVLAKLGLSKLPGKKFDPSNVPSVERARLQLANAEARYKRVKQLAEQKPPLVSPQDFADVTTSFEVAKTNFRVEQMNAQVILAEAHAKRADLDLVLQQLEDTVIRAPIPAGKENEEGRYGVAERQIDVGELLKIGDATFRLVADRTLRYRTQVPEKFSSLVRPGLDAEVWVESHTKPFRGKVQRVSPQIDQASRTFLVEVVLHNPDRALRAGSFGRGSIITHVDKEAIFVPASAISTFAGARKVVRVKEGKTVEVPIETGVTQGEFVEVTKGLMKEDMILPAVPSGLKIGSPVVIKGENSSTPAK